jgi:hypothetical protein
MPTQQPQLVVTFRRVLGAIPHSEWEAVRKTGGRVRGGHMPIGRGVIPHDLAHLATEAHLGIDDGFWGLLARGATYKRGTTARPTRRGRAIVRDNRARLHQAEQLGNLHHHAWVTGHPTPVAPTFERLAAAWRELPDGGTLTVRWPHI